MTLNCRPQLCVRIRGIKHAHLISPTESPYKTWAECLKQVSQDSGKQRVAWQQGREAGMHHLLFLQHLSAKSDTGPGSQSGSRRSPLALAGGGNREILTLREYTNPISFFFYPGRIMTTAAEAAPGTHKSQDFGRAFCSE